MKEAKLRRDARKIFDAALAAADPTAAVLRHVRVEGETLIAGSKRYHLRGFDNIYVVGAGKAGASMAKAVEKLLAPRIRTGAICVKHGHTLPLRRVVLYECGHPVPDEAGVAGARRVAEIVREAGERDLILCLISGGASALLPMPAAPITLAESQETTKLLLASGAPIQDINAVRKHIDQLKGGQLARLAAPATVVTLLLSDVIGGDLEVIGSGPTAPDPCTFATARAVLERYGILDRIPSSVRERILTAKDETPKPGDPLFSRVQNLIVGSNEQAVDAAAEEAKRRGYRTIVLSTFIEGETREAARFHAAIAKEIKKWGRPVRAPACIISGGETTVTIRGTGKGGRNQEFALAAAIGIAGMDNVVVLSGGTDGTDGPTDAAGAIADGKTAGRLPAASQYLDNNDSYHFFEKLGDLLITGPTNTNVMDVRLLLCDL